MDDTIVALSTAPGTGAMAVVRLSGKNSITIAASVFKGKNLAEQSSHTLHFGLITDGEKVIDEVVAGIFLAPHSYTKEDVVEITCHGSSVIAEGIIQLLIARGARAAVAGEFTLRAFLNGRLDLSQAEAVADLIAAGSEASRTTALNQMRGGFSSEIKNMRAELIHLAALLELELDFSEEDVQFANRAHLEKLITDLQSQILKLKTSFQLGNVIKNGVTTVIAGRPNAGKSTLLNALLNEERAIVSEIPGTTRDAIEEVINIKGIQFRLVDTAGLRDATDLIERMGVEKTLQKIQQSAIVLYVFDVTELNREDLQNDLARLPKTGLGLVALGNKIDGLSGNEWETKFAGINNLLFASAKEKLHLNLLKEKLVSLVSGNLQLADQTIVTNARHYEALLRANEAMEDVSSSLKKNISKELIAADIRRALYALGEITGEITTDDLLQDIFSKFCIGK